MKKFSKKFVAVTMAMVCSVATFSVNEQIQAASNKPALEHSTMVVGVGSTKTVNFKNNTKKIDWTVDNKCLVTITGKSSKYVKFKGKKTGNTTVTAKIGSKKFNIKVKVVKKSEYTTTHKGIGTFYEPASGGAANLDDFKSKYLTAALNTSDYMNNMAGAYLQVTDKDGDKVKVLIADRLPEGAKGDIDLSRKAFGKIENYVTGRMNISWKVIPLPTSKPISYLFKPTSTQYWAEVQVRNHRYPIVSLEYLNKKTGKYVKLQRQEYNYFTAPSGMGKGPFTFRVKDVYGHVLVDKNIKMNSSSKSIKGKANFPY